MRIAVTGKGGAGKTVLSALLARCLHEADHRVLAVDLDTNPGLAIALGLDPEDAPLPDEAVEQRDGLPYGWGLAAGLDPTEAAERYSHEVRPGLAFLGFGNIGGAEHQLQRYLTAVRQIVGGLDGSGWSLVGDLEAGPATPFEGFAAFADVTVVLVPPSPAGELAARRITSILDHEEHPWVAVAAHRHPSPDGTGMDGPADLPVVATIPYDPAVQDLERRGAVLDVDPASPALVAARLLTERLLEHADREVVAP